MKHNSIKYLILFAVFPVCLIIVYGGSRHPLPSEGIGKDWSSRPKCSDLITGDMVFTFHTLDLSYSLEDYGDAVEPDLGELSIAHGVNSFQKSGSITMLSNFFHNTSSYTGDNAPSIKVKYSGVDCTGYIEKEFTNIDGINANQITIPEIDHSLFIRDVHAEAKTIRTNSHQLQLMWSASVTLNHTTGEMEDDADVDGNLFSIVCQSPQANTLVLRSDETGIYYQVENTVIDLGNMENMTVDFSTMAEVDCPSLKKPINIGGDLSGDFEWDGPILIPIAGDETIGLE